MELIHRIYRVISPRFRRRRFEMFMERIAPGPKDVILDVGGYPFFWTAHPPVGDRVDTLNLHSLAWDPAKAPNHRIRTLEGDGCALEFPSKSYEIVFSNSVIEHVGTYERQERFASEIRRVGRRLWVQTPAREFFVEPHYLAPLIHWLPKPWQLLLARNFTLWGVVTRPDADEIRSRVDELRLLTLDEMRVLFPDCEILKERFLGVFTKSYIAVRNQNDQQGD